MDAMTTQIRREADRGLVTVWTNKTTPKHHHDLKKKIITMADSVRRLHGNKRNDSLWVFLSHDTL